MTELSKRAARMAARITRQCAQTPPYCARDCDGRWWTAKGNGIANGPGLAELIETGALIPQEDGLLPGCSQTFRLRGE